MIDPIQQLQLFISSSSGNNRGGERHLDGDAADLLRVGAVRARLGLHGRDHRLRRQDVLRSLGRRMSHPRSLYLFSTYLDKR